jgi:hypothetical protein
MKHRLMVTAWCAVLPLFLSAQVVWTEPPFPSASDQVTLYYDASQGNGELEGVIPVYIHTGLITSNSTSPTDWQYVNMPWASTDPDWVMDFEGSNLWSYNFGGQTLGDFFGLPSGVTAEQLAMVFRNGNGSLVGRDTDGSDIFLPLNDGSFSAVFLQPQTDNALAVVGELFPLQASASEPASLAFVVGGDTLASADNAVQLSHEFSPEMPGTFVVEFHADNGASNAVISTTVLVLPDAPPAVAAPAGTSDGLNPSPDGTSMVLQLYAPGKSHVFFVGDLTDWATQAPFMMNVTPEGDRFWIELTDLNPQQEYRYQFHVLPNDDRFPDPYAEKQLDYWNDPWIPESTYPFLIDFPTGQTNQSPVSVFQTGGSGFNWTDGDFERPAQENLVIYELLVRDFSEERTFDFIIDTLDYLASLNITALELMPVNEFNGNDSWGYNPSFYFAVDKAYGPKDKLQELIDACHERGIAVILDMVMNHSDWPNPQILMWWENNAPSADNPFFNTVAPPNGVDFFFDYNHQAEATQDFTKRVMDFWREEFHVDGFRWDLSQGFTWNGSGGGYDQDRIDLWAEYGAHVWSQDPGFYMILEHWTDNNEEKALSDLGFMTWANVTHDFQESAMGYSSNLAWASWQERGWNHPRSVSYAESHDEERLMYKNLQFGNGNGGYSITDLETALARMELAACFNLPLPGPKMIWQFGELGYDFSINTCSDGVTVSEDCRVAAKPVKWEYREVPARYRIYQVMAALSGLKRDHAVFQSTDFTWDVWGYGKRLLLNGNDMNVVVAGNFQVSPLSMVPGFQHTGTWYDYFSGASIQVADVEASWDFEPGEYHLWTDVPLETPENILGIEEARQPAGFSVVPNPGLRSHLALHEAATSPGAVKVFDLTGRCAVTLDVPTGAEQVALPTGLPEGPYLIRYTQGSTSSSTYWLKQE